LSKSTKVTIDELGAKIAEGQIKSLPVVLKADVGGTLEALKLSLEKLRNDEVKVNVLSSAIGDVTENDVVLAGAGEEKAIIVGFNVKETPEAKRKAKQEGIEVKLYNIIYELIDDIKERLSEMLTPEIEEQITGKAEVRELFAIPKIGTIAGCMVVDGVIHNDDYARVIRGEEVICEAPLSSLKRFKDDVKEVKKGVDCGIMVEGFNEYQPYDIIETFRKNEKKAVFK
jgi:translation initiation factor IF-2